LGEASGGMHLSVDGCLQGQQYRRNRYHLWAPSQAYPEAMMAALRLNVEMIPTSTWNINVRAEVAPDVWDTLRYHFKATADAILS
jgi:hypothetical protein